MRGLRAALPLLLVVLTFAASFGGCKRKKKAQATTPEPAAVLLSVVNVADPVGAVQLAAGFFELESNTWRWTSRKFTVVLRPPDGAAERGARLELHLNLPGVIVERIGPVTVAAEIGGHALSPERYTRTGDYVYASDVDGSWLRNSAATIHFSTDKALPPTGADTRELALIVTGVGLVAK
jgi:hypothetical protein